jgi:uncharacterized protein
MKLISVNIGKEETLVRPNKTEQTGIFKKPVPGKAQITSLGLPGDFIGDAKHHGGQDQALYLYTLEDYAFWQTALEEDLPPGSLGENITLAGCSSADLKVGDILQMGQVTLQVTAPRIPCGTLAGRMKRPDFVKQFRQAGLPGAYCRVLQEGWLQAGQEVTLQPYPQESPTLAEVMEDYFAPDLRLATLRRYLAAPLAERVRRHKETQLQQELITQAAAYVRAEMEKDASGHDWWHIHRVWQTARQLAEGQSVDTLVLELAALLHDLDDWKLSPQPGDAPLRAQAWMQQQGISPAQAEQISAIIRQLSFKGADVPTPMQSLEGEIVQDADRLDAIGAIGIARAFAYGGSKGRPLYDPASPPQRHRSFEEYKASGSATINHFYEKLLLLKERMNTPAARLLAEERHAFMEEFLARFLQEWQA